MEDSELELNAIVGASSQEKLRNILKGIYEAKIELQIGVYKKRKQTEGKPYAPFNHFISMAKCIRYGNSNSRHFMKLSPL